MLGKRSRPLLPTSSKLSFFHGEDCDPKPVNAPASRKHPSVPQHVMLGFEIQQETKLSDVCESPRSVLDPSEKHPPGRSFRSFVRALPLQNRGSQGVGLAIIVGIHAEEKGDLESLSPVGHDSASMPRHHELSPSSVCPENNCCRQRSQPIAIATNCSSQDEPTSFKWSKFLESSGSEDASVGNALDMDVFGVDLYFTQEEYVAHDRTTYNVADEDSIECPSIFSVASIPSSYGSVGIHSAASFLDACAFCRRAFVPGKDIFMYRGDQAFCSAECRGERITIDDHKEKLMYS